MALVNVTVLPFFSMFDWHKKIHQEAFDQGSGPGGVFPKTCIPTRSAIEQMGIPQAGLRTDHLFRPVDQDGKSVHPKLFAAGSILAHQDWIRMKCGAGGAIATAYKAVQAICH